MRVTTRVGVYVDGYNLYYGGRNIMGRGTPDWRWLDVRSLAQSLFGSNSVPPWASGQVTRVVYCTARIGGSSNPGSIRDQNAYIEALAAHGSIDVLEEGFFREKTVRGPHATRGTNGKPQLVSPPVMGEVATREEKGSDVNVASHLLIDVLEGSIDAAIVVSNDSDLKFPIVRARQHVPVGMVNPHGRKRQTAGALKGSPQDGVGGHWWRALQPDDFTQHQLPDPVGPIHKPLGW